MFVKVTSQCEMIYLVMACSSDRRGVLRKKIHFKKKIVEKEKTSFVVNFRIDLFFLHQSRMSVLMDGQSCFFKRAHRYPSYR
ncbi:hypothetical protein V1477_008975 [Vespula maculifrons]|uniref:Uncharacterized protein n=1 Tax=Vespula maculifrons TaxID=7453 RepID=A0ABD2CEI9_VESMC